MTTIEPLQLTDWVAAFERVMADLPAQVRAERVRHCMQMIELGRLDPAGVWVARHDGTIIGVQVCVSIAGGACLFWLPAADDEVVAEALVRAGLAWCRSRGSKLAQAFVPPAQIADAEPLLRQGFRRMTRMHQLQHDLFEPLPTPPGSLTFVPYSRCRAEFTATLKRTYERTLDCPELNGLRTMDEIIAGHQGEGKFDPDCWWLTRQGRTAVGVLMLTEMEDGIDWELSYLGIVPEQRRRGHGRAMLAHALVCARDRLARRLIIAVDGRNAPAVRLYESMGFVEYECHDVLLNTLGESQFTK